MTGRELLGTIVREHEAGRRVALCVVVATRGSTPQPPGAMLVVNEAANIYGTLGGGCVEAEVRRLAHQQLAAGVGRLVTFELDNDFGYDDGMICGGSMDVAIQPVAPTDDIGVFARALAADEHGDARLPIRVVQDGVPVEYRIRLEDEPRLLIAGAGHISRILSEISVKLGFDVHVVDDRRDFANERRFPEPVERHVGPIADTLTELDVDARTYVVIVTRGHRHDEVALRAVLDTPAKYIGMIGSRRKIDVIFEDLRHAGVSEARLARIHAPIGLDIGAVTTQEIAVSIAAELVKVRRASHRPAVEGPIPVSDTPT